MDRSAIVVLVLTCVVADAVLFAVLGSGWEADTRAVFVIVLVCDGLVTLMLIVALAPLARLPTVQVTVPAEFVQLPWLDVAETKVTPLGRVSVTVTPVAGLGPLLVATIVYTIGLLVLTVVGAVFVMDMSAVPVPWIVVTADAWLLAVFGSDSLPPITAVFVIVPGDGGAVPLMVIVTLAPAARLPTVQLTVPEALVQVPWVDDADTKVT